jgi:hypothetical protein
MFHVANTVAVVHPVDVAFFRDMSYHDGAKLFRVRLCVQTRDFPTQIKEMSCAISHQILNSQLF